MRHRCWILLLAGLCVLAAACRPASEPATPTAAPPGAAKPAEAVRLLTGHLRGNALDAFARDALPPEVYAQLEAAWREGRTRWPLDELPFGERMPQILATLAEPGSETRLRQVFDRQFANADREIDSAAATLGLFGVQYVRGEDDFSEGEREHYSQLITAASRWAQDAALSNPARACAAIAKLTTAARGTGLASEADFARLGLRESLRRLAPFVATGKQVLADYGLDLDASLGTLDASLQSQTGDTALVRMRYTLGDEAIDAVIAVERHDGRWYVGDFLRHAKAGVKRPAAPVQATPATPTTPAKPAAPAVATPARRPASA